MCYWELVYYYVCFVCRRMERMPAAGYIPCEHSFAGYPWCPNLSETKEFVQVLCDRCSKQCDEIKKEMDEKEKKQGGGQGGSGSQGGSSTAH